MRRCVTCTVLVLLFFSVAVPVLADEGGDRIVLWGDHVVVRSGDRVAGNVVVLGGSVEVQEGGRVQGDVVAFGGECDVDGQVEGSLVVVGGELRLGSRASVGEDLVTVGAGVTRAEEARVSGQEVDGLRWRFPEDLAGRWPGIARDPRNLSWSPVEWSSGLAGSLVRWTMRTLALMALGVVVVLLLPKYTSLVAQTASAAPLPSIGVGLLTFVVLLFLVPLLVIICIGIPVVVALSVVFLAALILGRVAIGTVVGQRLIQGLNLAPDQPLLEVVLGIGLVELLTSVPCFGTLAGFALSLAGLGAVVLTRFGTAIYEPLGGQKVSAIRAPDEGAQEA
jgi:hypothetical protein